MEDARESKKELQIATQDMHKAYNSIGLQDLKKALERIDLSASFIVQILELFHEKKMKVLTEFSPSTQFQVLDGMN